MSGAAPRIADSPEWDVRPAPRRVVAVGDLHGDLRAFGAIGRACGLLDERGSWRGAGTHLVLMGDLVGGEHSRLLLNAVIRLEREAFRAGGRVHALLGNHDLLPIAGRFGKLTRRERREYQKSDFQGEGLYAQWVLGRPTILKIGRTLYVHAGLDRWALDIDPGEVNAHVRAWIAHLQGVGPRPPRETRWTFDDDDGPMWTRAFRDRGRRPKDAPSRKTIRAILERLGAERIVLGHSPTDDGSIVLDHPHYGGSVVLIDTRISDRKRGRLGALAIEGDVLRPVYADDRADGDGLREREAREAAKPEGLVHRVLAKLGDIFKGGRRR
ncbi:MAG TPA: metallophosphoesterase [Verrucomicrobiae bacterium]|nr:metallophosphoesterase [Verrucomicrobiae bacterium]